jgi:hypothetical protein
MGNPVRVGGGIGLFAIALSLVGAAAMPSFGQVSNSRKSLPTASSKAAQSDPLPLAFVETTFPDATVGVLYASSIQATGGSGLLAINVTGDLPPGVIVDTGANSVVLFGVPSEDGQFAFQINVRDANGAALQGDYTIQVYPQTALRMSQIISPKITDTETITFNDAENVFFPIVISDAEIITLTDNVLGLDAAVVVDNESITLTDNVAGMDSAVTVDTEDIALTDTENISILTVPAITWPTPAAIPWGTALSGTQLDASTSPAGVFVYNPPPGTVLPVGLNTLSVTFTPSNLNAFTSATATVQITVTKATQTITVTPVSGTQTALTSVGLSAMASSGLAVTFTSATPTVCSVSGSTASLLTSGVCVVHVSQAGNVDYSSAPTVSIDISVAKAAQTITFPTIAAEQFAASTLTLSATASSGLAVTFTSATPTVCTISASTAALLTQGTCIVQATQAGNVTYAAAPLVQQNIPVHLAAQTITFPAPATEQFALTQLQLTATASSALPITYSSITPAVCTVSGSTASLLEQGICYLHATQAGNNTYSVAPLVGQNFVVHLAPQTITFPAITATEYVLSSLTLSATASSGLTVAFASVTPAVCTVSGTTASLLTTGDCVIHATQAGNATVYSVAPLVSQSFIVHVNPQTITFPAITATLTAASTLPLTATASSGLTVAFASTTPAVCTVSGITASLLTSGTCILQATQAGNADYAAAPMVQQNVAVHLATQTITFPAIAAQVVGANVTLGATASSGLTVAYTSVTTPVCTVNGSTATMLSAGACVIHATQAGNASYGPAALVSKDITVTAAARTEK